MAVDPTLPTDNSRVASWPEVIRDLATAVATLENIVAQAGYEDYQRTIVAQNISAAITTLNRVYTVNSASAVTITLPEVTGNNKGEWVRIHKMGVGNLTITPGGSDVMAAGGAGVALANITAGEPKLAFLELEVVASGHWMISGMLGTWA